MKSTTPSKKDENGANFETISHALCVSVFIEKRQTWATNNKRTKTSKN